MYFVPNLILILLVSGGQISLFSDISLNCSAAGFLHGWWRKSHWLVISRTGHERPLRPEGERAKVKIRLFGTGGGDVRLTGYLLVRLLRSGEETAAGQISPPGRPYAAVTHCSPGSAGCIQRPLSTLSPTGGTSPLLVLRWKYDQKW